MDRGAHFHRCDFQVHTPRDINWQGFRPASDEERKEYAKGFIAACRAKGLDAVAITDHHDMGFFPYIVVNGDADLVIVCDYRTAGDQSGGKIKCQGAIDVAEIRKEITTVMEGGRDAFRLRKEKYGF